MLTRRGTSLPELLVALALAATVLSIATSSVLRQQRVHTRIRAQSGSETRLRAATMILGAQLAQLDAAAGDITTGAANDTAVQFRAPVATSFACDRSVGSAVLLPELDSGGDYAATIAGARTGDTLWWLGDSSWSAARVTAVTPITVTCTGPVRITGPSVRLTLAGGTDTVPATAPLRLTRSTRYSLYRSGDGTWQLGFREWNDAAGAFASPQPVAGPLLLRVAARRSGYRYFDAVGQELTPTGGPIDVTRISRIRITLQSLIAVREPGQDSVRTDSVDVGLRRGGS